MVPCEGSPKEGLAGNPASRSEVTVTCASWGEGGMKKTLTWVFSPCTPSLTTWAFDKPWKTDLNRIWKASITSQRGKDIPKILGSSTSWELGGVPGCGLGGLDSRLRHLWKGYSSVRCGSYSTQLLVLHPVVTNHPSVQSNSSGSHAQLSRWAMEPDKPGLSALR